MYIQELEEELRNKKCALLCGNGISINFDSGFSKVFENLFCAHTDLYKKTKYDIKANDINFSTKCNENYDAICNELRTITKTQYNLIFEDGIAFAKSIVDHPRIYDDLKNNELLTELVFGKSEWTCLASLYDVGIKKGSSSVNIEYWTILIYFYFAIKKIDPDYYKFPKNNKFLNLIQIGYKSKATLSEELENEIHTNVIFNGLNIYFKMLFSLAIYNSGKATNLERCDKISKIDNKKINVFLNSFQTIFTLNYDHLIEKITGRKDIKHLHGSYILDKIEYVYYQSFSIIENNETVSCSDIMIGDYFINKTLYPIIAKFSSKLSTINKRIELEPEIITDETNKKRIETYLIFGMNIENDQNILRNIMVAFYSAKILKPKIIYAYCTENEKQEFEKQFFEVITFDQNMSDYARNINVEYIETRIILERFFK
ncbi:hypothetical protein [Methanimicrococcus blatticola]|uniref:SIR2-like protein n=1 Tax=Methanimicrococcus blatticola TaxID=91560 RepID=A0A484F630_9EURY|nr:hypothetical protein [Methanimicrococcus blatticola]MBZ3935157.1 hypothetical protein [Methanimicrococcus blatticola]MCC2508746.1 hypothetical protein [Methanimicrococcus blatticola]TDQ71219.1 hypothetical protein C7391_0324 [Methanimicrococcus blatticola]